MCGFPASHESGLERSVAHAQPGLEWASSDPWPAQRLRALLAESRRDGERFAVAWTRAVALVCEDHPWASSQNWRAAFEATKSAWRDSYVNVGWRLKLTPDLLDQPSHDRGDVELVA